MKKSCLVLLALLAAGCSTIPMDEKKPIEIRRGFFELPYKQDGKSLDMGSMKATLRRLPASKDSAEKSSTFETLELVTGIPGGGLVGWYLGSKAAGGTVSDTLLYIGAPLAVASIIFDIIARNHLDDAISAHNGTFAKSSERRRSWSLSPVVAFERESAIGGIRVRF